MSDVSPFSRPRLSRAGLAVVCGLVLWIPVAQIPVAQGQGDLTVTSGSLATASSGTFGSVSVSGTSPAGDRSTLTVTGAIAIDSGLTVSDRGLVVGQATIDLGAGSGIVFDGGTLDLQSGTFSASGLFLSGTSSFARTGGAYAVSTLGLTAGAPVTLTADDRFVGPSEFSPASITLSSGATLTLQSNLVGSEGADVELQISGSTGGLVRTTQSYAVSSLFLDNGAALTFAAGDSVDGSVSIAGGATLTLDANVGNPGLSLSINDAGSTLARTTQTVTAYSLSVYDGATFALAAGDVVDNIEVGVGSTLTLPSTAALPVLTLESLSLASSITGLADRPYDLGYLALDGVGLTLRTGAIDDQISRYVFLEAGGTLTLAKNLVLTSTIESGSQSGLTIFGSTSGLIRNDHVISVGSVFIGEGAIFTIEAGDTVSEAISVSAFDEAATLTLGRSVELAGEYAEVYLSGALASIQRGDPAYTITGTGASIQVGNSASFEIATGDSFTDAEVEVWEGGVLSNASSQSFATVRVVNAGSRFQADAPLTITGTSGFSGARLSVTDGGVFAAAANVSVTDAIVALGTLELLSGTFTADLLAISGSGGFDRDSGAAYAVGTLSLSSAATATFTNVDSIGELSLDSLAALSATAPLGLESLEITDGGLLTLEAFTGGGLDGYLWGLRLAGNQETSLAAWLASGAITTDAEWEILFDDSGEQTYTFVAVAVPEPGSVVLAALGLLTSGWWRRRLRRRGPLAAEPLEPRLALAADTWPTAVITLLPPAEGQPGDTVQWSVAFTEPVTGVDAADFRLVAGGGVSTMQAQLSISGAGDTYSVTVTRVRGEGTLRLDLADDGSIRDVDGNPLRPTATTPTFSLQPEFSVGSGSPHPREGLKSVDLNGDGILDLVVSNTTSKTLSILLGSGTGSFRSGTPITIAGSLGAIEAADLDGDGRVDLVVASPDQDVVRVLLNRGNASFAAAVSYATRDTPYSLRVADFDGDGRLDIAAATWGGAESVSLLRGNGNGTFQPRQDLYPTRLLHSVLTGDFTGDGRPDVVVSDFSVSSLSIFVNAGGGSFLAPATIPIDAGLPSVMAAGDIDGDGNLDIAAVESFTAAISVLLGNGDGTFQPRKGIGTGVAAGAVALHDVTGDGRIDLVMTLPILGQVVVQDGRGDGTFGAARRFSVGTSPGSLTIGDFNRDGRSDVAVAAGTTTGSVRVLLNAAAGGVTGPLASVAVTTPPAPLNLVVTRGDREVTLAWDAPATTGGSALTGYLVQRSEDGGTTWRSTPRTLADGRQLTATGLSNGASYLFRVAAVNAVGTGAFTAASEAVKPVGYASEPRSVVGTAGDGVVNLSWDGPAETGGDITDYVIEYRTVSGTGSGSWTVVTRPASAATSAIVTGLVNGREYLFRVAAVNSLGQGAYGTTTTPTVPKTTPGMVTGLAAVAGNGLIDVAWTALSAAATGGSPITGSVVEYKTVDAESWTRLPVVTAPATSVRVTGLVNGTPYLYRVAAMNAVGLGAFTEGPAAAGPFEPAAAPVIESVTLGSRELTLSWALPTSDGGSPITDYVVQYRLASPSIWTTLVRSPSPDRSATVTGLANGNAYLFRVAAITAAGPGNWSPVSAPATPVGLPSSAGVVRTAPGDGSVRLFWMEAWNAGAPITNYTIDYSLDTTDPEGWARVERPASTALSAVVSGLANGVSHVFRVRAVNAIGAGEPSYSAPTMPNILPGAPGSVTATAANRSATLTWTAPAANGGTAVTAYAIQYRAGELGQWVTFGRTTTAATSATVSGLVNGLPHAFRVAAVNALGTGDYSEASAAVTPSAVAAPTVLGVAIRGTPEFGASQVSWDITFSKPVTGVDASDFATVTGGLTTVGTRSVTGSGATYVVTASGITGAGTVGLNLVDNGSIRDAAGNRLAQAGTTSFQQTNVTMGLLPMSLAVADVNGDGRPDLITANDGNARVSVRLGLANGTYQAAANYAVGANPRGVAVADVNRDGRLDIVVADRGGSTVTWLRGSGTGSFVAQPRLSAGSAPSAVVVADVNLDGLPDFVVANPLARTVSILAQTSSGGFQSRRSVSVPGTPNSLAVADVNLDGRPDIVTADSNGSTVAVLLGNGNLTFQPPQLFAANARPDGLTLADLDGDGLLDIVVVNTQSGTVSVLAGTGSGGFRTAMTYAVGANPSAVTVADVDGDTRPDLVVTNAFSAAASVLLADGSGGFQERRSLASGGFPVAAAAADFNGDGRSDLAVVDAFLPGVKLFTNGLNGTTTGGVAALAPLPGAPSLTTAGGGNARATLSWTAGDNGGVPITNYVIERRSEGGEWTPVTRPVSAAMTATVTGLTNGTTYEFRVAAVTAIGRGEFSGALSVTPAPVAPGEVIPESPVAGNGQATVSWLAPLDDGGAPASDYVVQYRTVSGDWTTLVREPSTVRSAVVTGLTNGTTYVFRFAAVNVAGTGEFSTAVMATPIGPPEAPAAAPTGSGGPATVTVSWTSPVGTGGSEVTSYTLQISTDDGASWTTVSRAPSVATTAAVTGLVNGTPYRFRVAAVNAAGTGAYSAASDAISPRLLAPSSPRYVLGYPGDGQVRLVWAAPASDGGSPILDYDIHYSTDLSATWTKVTKSASTATTYTLTGLANGAPVQFWLAAVNAIGVGDSSGVSTYTPATVPQAPGTVTAVGGNGSATVSWSAPASNGGAAITDYTLQVRAGAGEWTTVARAASTATSATVTGLTNGTSYTFRVAAVNEQGTGAFGSESVAVIPAPVAPGTPRNVVASAAEGGATVSWFAPLTDGGAAVSDYTVQYSADNGGTWTTFVRSPSTAVSATVTGLDPSSRYVFRVAAVNTAGRGDYAQATGAAVTPAAGVNPRVVSIVLAQPYSISSTSLTWNVTFSKPVTGVTASVFRVETASAVYTSFTVSGSGASYTVTVTGISGWGSIGLNLDDWNGLIRDAGGRALMSGAVVPSTSVSNLPTFNSSVPTHMQVADVNGDGWLDIGMRYNTNWRVTIRLATGPGTFGPETLVSEWWSRDLQFADVNRDGRQDMVLQSGTRVALGNGDGTFAAPQDLTWVWRTNGDLNGDGIQDVVEPITEGIRVRLGTAAGDFLPAQTVATGAWTGCDVIDVNRDGRADIVARSSSGIDAILNNGDGTFQAPWALLSGWSGTFVTAIADLDGDGWQDLAASHGPSKTVTVFTGGTGEGLTFRQTYAASDNSFSKYNLVVADLTGDGRPDLLVDSVMLTGQGDGTFKASQRIIADSGYGELNVSEKLLVADFNADGRLDVLAGSGGYTGAGLYLNVTGRQFTGERIVRSAAPGKPGPITATAGNQQATLTWTAPSSGYVSNYQIDYSSDGGSTWTYFNRSASTATTATVTGLKNGREYVFRVAAIGSYGGPYSDVSAICVPATVPDAPWADPWIGSGEGAFAVPPNLVRLRFRPGTLDGGSPITNFVVQMTSDNGVTWTTIDRPASTLPVVTIPGTYTAGATYGFRIAAVNAVGTSAFYTMNSVKFSAPTAAPTGLSANWSGGGEVDLSWSPSAAVPGNPTTSAIVEYTTNGTTWIRYSGLIRYWYNGGVGLDGIAPGSYRFRVAEVNASGTGPFSTASVSGWPQVNWLTIYA